MSDVQFDRWLKNQLMRREWSESDLARKMGIRPSVVNRWVRGERVPSSESAERIADVLGTDIDWVLTLTNHRPKELAVKNGPLEDLIAVMRRVEWSDDRLAFVRAAVESMPKRKR